MKNELKRLAFSGMLLAGAAISATAAAPSDASATASGVAKRLLDTCPNPAPYWCTTGKEEMSCLDGDLAWRGCKARPEAE